MGNLTKIIFLTIVLMVPGLSLCDNLDDLLASANSYGEYSNFEPSAGANEPISEADLKKIEDLLAKALFYAQRVNIDKIESDYGGRLNRNGEFENYKKGLAMLQSSIEIGDVESQRLAYSEIRRFGEIYPKWRQKYFGKDDSSVIFEWGPIKWDLDEHWLPTIGCNSGSEVLSWVFGCP
jgi:hypothetical protein